MARQALLGFSLLFFAWLVGPLHALAETPPESNKPVNRTQAPEVIVSARRIPGRSLVASRFPGNVTVLTAEDIRQLQPATTPQAIAYAEGVTLMDQQGFGLGADGTLNMRGIVNSSRTNSLVLVDGIRQNRITGDDVHWQSIPVSQIERIEIIRGGGASSYGEGALAGVINIVTKQDSDKLLETEHGVEVGSFGWQQYTTNVRGKAQPLRYSLNYARRQTTGYREYSQSRNTTITAHTGVDLLPGVSADLHVMHSEDTTGFPGLLTLVQTQQRRIQTNAFHGINKNEIDQVSLDLAGGPWAGFSGLITGYWRRWVQQSEDSINFNAFTVTPSHGLNLRGNHEWEGDTVDHLLIGGIELSEDKATTGDPGVGTDSESNRAGYGLYLEETLTFADRLSLVGGLRFDKFRYEESLTFPAFDGTLRFEGWSPKVGVAFDVIPEALNIFTSYSRPFKSPNVDDFSSRLGSSFSGNADLQPQQADTYEVGAKLKHAHAEIGGTFFYTRINDEILFDPFAFTNQNFDTRRYGVELSSRAVWAQRLRAHMTYTFVDSEFIEGQFDRETIPGSPEHTLNTGLGICPMKGLWIDLLWYLVNDYYRINDLNNRLGKADNYGVLNLRLSYTLPRPAAAGKLWPETTAYLNIDNITHEEYSAYQSSNGTSLTGAGEAPMPPISFTGGVRVKF